MTTREYFQRRRHLRLAWNALTRAADVAGHRHAFDAVRDALSWLAAPDGAQASPAAAADWIATNGPDAGISEGDLTTLRSILGRDDAAFDLKSATASLRDALPSVWRLLDAERSRLARLCPPGAVIVLVARTVVSLCLIAAVAAGSTRGLMRVRQLIKPNGFWVTYYSGTDLRGRKATRIEPVLVKDYGDGSPAFGIGGKAWSARWETRIKIGEADEYMFISKSRDGIRVFIDDRLLIDNWREQDWADSLRKAGCRLGEGIHTVRVEHVVFRGEGAIQVQWIGGPIKERTDLGGSGVMRPPLRECMR